MPWIQVIMVLSPHYRAARCIQRAWRGYSVRVKYPASRRRTIVRLHEWVMNASSRHDAAKYIQRFWRRRRYTQASLLEDEEGHNASLLEVEEGHNELGHHTVIGHPVTETAHAFNVSEMLASIEEGGFGEVSHRRRHRRSGNRTAGRSRATKSRPIPKTTTLVPQAIVLRPPKKALVLIEGTMLNRYLPDTRRWLPSNRNYRADYNFSMFTPVWDPGEPQQSPLSTNTRDCHLNCLVCDSFSGEYSKLHRKAIEEGFGSTLQLEYNPSTSSRNSLKPCDCLPLQYVMPAGLAQPVMPSEFQVGTRVRFTDELAGNVTEEIWLVIGCSVDCKGKLNSNSEYILFEVALFSPARLEHSTLQDSLLPQVNVERLKVLREARYELSRDANMVQTDLMYCMQAILRCNNDNEYKVRCDSFFDVHKDAKKALAVMESRQKQLIRRCSTHKQENPSREALSDCQEALGATQCLHDGYRNLQSTMMQLVTHFHKKVISLHEEQTAVWNHNERLQKLVDEMEKSKEDTAACHKSEVKDLKCAIDDLRTDLHEEQEKYEGIIEAQANKYKTLEREMSRMDDAVLQYAFRRGLLPDPDNSTSEALAPPQCVVCCTHPATMVMLPCWHQVVCEGCSVTLMERWVLGSDNRDAEVEDVDSICQCPMCKQEVKQVKKPFCP